MTKIPFGLLERYTFVEAKKLHNFGRGSCPKGRKKAPPPQDAESAQASIKVYLFGGAVGTRKARPIRLLQMSDLRPCNRPGIRAFSSEASAPGKYAPNLPGQSGLQRGLKEGGAGKNKAEAAGGRDS